MITQQEKLTKLKSLLGISDSSKEILIEFALEKAKDMICNYCRIDSVPTALENVQLSMAMDIYRSDSLGKEQVEGTVKSMTEGDVSISFSSAFGSGESSGTGFLKSYTIQLDKFRKLGW